VLPWFSSGKPTWGRAAATVGVGLFVIALGLIFGGASSADGRRSLTEHGVAVDGTVQTVFGKERTGGFGGYTYVYSWQGQLHQESASNGADGFYPGAPVTVLVDPDDPSRSVVQGRRAASSGGTASDLGLVAIVVGAGIVVLGLHECWRCRRGRPV